MQLLMGISTIRYFPPSGTAGFERSMVSGNRRVPAPPPMMIASVFWETEDRLMGFILGVRSCLLIGVCMYLAAHRKICHHRKLMCGIVGYIGKAEAVPILLDGLRRLEYRGYDSAGVATISNGDIETR